MPQIHLGTWNIRVENPWGGVQKGLFFSISRGKSFMMMEIWGSTPLSVIPSSAGMTYTLESHSRLSAPLFLVHRGNVGFSVLHLLCCWCRWSRLWLQQHRRGILTNWSWDRCWRYQWYQLVCELDCGSTGYSYSCQWMSNKPCCSTGCWKLIGCSCRFSEGIAGSSWWSWFVVGHCMFWSHSWNPVRRVSIA